MELLTLPRALPRPDCPPPPLTCTLAPQIRGATSHYDAVVGAATSGCLGAANDSGVPVIFGVITTENMEQVGGKHLFSA